MSEENEEKEVKPQGWITYVAGVGAICAGIVAIYNGDVIHGGQGIIGGLALIGLRGAIAKVIKSNQQ